MWDLGLYSGYILACCINFFLGLIFIIFLKLEDKRYLAKLFFCSLILQLILIPLYYVWLDAYGYDGFSFVDDSKYDYDGYRVARAWLSGLHFAEFRAANNGFYYFTAFVYYIFGQNTLMVRAFNALAGSLCIFFVYKTAQCHFNNTVARRAAFITAFFPVLIFWCINHFKDAILMLATIITLYLGSTLIVKKKLGITQCIGLIFSFIAIYTFRYAIAVPLFGFVFMYFYFCCLKDISILRFVLVSLLIGFILFGILRVTGEGTYDIMQKFQSTTERVSARTIESGKKVEGTTAHLTSFAAIRSYRELYKFPFAFATFMTIPYPPIPRIFTAGLPSQVYYVATFLFVCILSYIVVGWYYIFRHKTHDAFLLYFIPFIFISAAAVTNLGVLRYRAQWLPVFALLAAIGMEHRKDYKIFIYVFNIFIIIIAPVIYWILKSLT